MKPEELIHKKYGIELDIHNQFDNSQLTWDEVCELMILYSKEKELENRKDQTYNIQYLDNNE